MFSVLKTVSENAACRRSGISVMSRRYLDIRNFLGNWRKSLNFGVFATLNLKFFWGSSPRPQPHPPAKCNPLFEYPGYVPDILLFFSSPSQQNCARVLSSALSDLSVLVDDLGLQINVKKTQAMFVLPRAISRTDDVLVYCHGRALETVASYKYYPGQKKEPSSRFAARKTLFHVWYHARSQAISAGQKSRTVADRTLPCADRLWSSMISHVEQRSSRRESQGWFFFLSRVVPWCISWLRAQLAPPHWSRFTESVQDDICTSHRWVAMGPVRIRHSSHHFGWQSSHSVDLAGWQAKMASIEIWIPWRNAHKPHWH